YAALAGRMPEGGMNLRALQEIRPEITQELMTILERSTASRPQDRFASAGELQRALSAYQARRFPLFTHASLGEIVAAKFDQPVFEDQASTTLVSLSGASLLAAASVGDPAEQIAEARGGTRRMERRAPVPKQKRGRRWWWGGTVALGATTLF